MTPGAATPEVAEEGSPTRMLMSREGAAVELVGVTVPWSFDEVTVTMRGTVMSRALIGCPRCR